METSQLRWGHGSEFFEVACHDFHTNTHPLRQDGAGEPASDMVAIVRGHRNPQLRINFVKVFRHDQMENFFSQSVLHLPTFVHLSRVQEIGLFFMSSTALGTCGYCSCFDFFFLLFVFLLILKHAVL